jgi:hypothetical protein
MHEVILLEFRVKIGLLAAWLVQDVIEIFFGVVRGIGEVVPTKVEIVKVLHCVLL